MIIGNIGCNDNYVSGPLRAGCVTGGLCSGSRIYLDGRHLCSASLGRHQGHHSRSRPYVKHAASWSDIGPRTQQDAVGAHLHGAILLIDRETFELEPAV